MGDDVSAHLWTFRFPYCVYLWLAGATFGLGGTVVFLVGLNKQFSPQLNGRNDLGMCLRGLFSAPWCRSRLHHRAGHTHKL